MEETWKPYPDRPNRLEVSNLSRVRNKNKILPGSKNTGGYIQFTVSTSEKKVTLSRSRMVAKTWIPNPENKPCVNHINGIKDDDRIENLEWCTYAENILHSIHVLGNMPKRIIYKTGANHQRAIPVKMLDKSGNVIKTYGCIRAVKKDGFCEINVAAVARVVGNTHKGYKWEYA